MQISHIFFANILLFNFLIAILSFTYEKMQMISIFKYKVNLYRYSERYIIAMENGPMGEFVLHPPPISALTLFILPFSLTNNMIAKASTVFSYFIFWAENLIFLLFFLAYELLLVPLVYLKTFFNIVTTSIGLFTILFHCGIWFISGVFFSLFLVLRDLSFLFKILMMHEGCR